MGMALILLIISLLLFLGFFGLTVMEAETGVRFLERPRGRFDAYLMRMAFVARHIDWGDLLSHVVESMVARVVHDVAHWSLLFVRFVERELTNIVQYLRNRRPNVLAPHPSRSSSFAQTKEYLQRMFRISEHKGTREHSEDEGGTTR